MLEYSLIALVVTFPFLITYLTRGDVPFWRAVEQGTRRAQRTRVERQSDAMLESLLCLPPDLEISAYTVYFDPAYPKIRTALTSRLAQRRNLVADFRWILENEPVATQVWALDVLRDLLPQGLSELAPQINTSLARLADELRAAPLVTEYYRQFCAAEKYVGPALAAVAAFRAEGADCTRGLRALAVAAEQYPASERRDAFVSAARKILYAKGARPETDARAWARNSATAHVR